MEKTKKEYTTAETAKKCNVSKSTILNWLEQNPKLEPARKPKGKIEYRVWTDEDIRKLIKYRDNK